MISIEKYEKVLEIITASGFLKLRKSNTAEWETAQKSILLLPTQYLSDSIKYQELYFKEKLPFYEDISLMIVKGGVVVGLWPLCMFTDYDGHPRLGSLGTPIVHPMLVDNYYCKPKTLRSFWSSCLEFIQECMACLGIKECSFQQHIMGAVDVWHKKLSECDVTINTVKHRLYRDIQMDETDVNKCLHRTTVQDIKYGRQIYDAEIITRNDSSISDHFERFRKLHIQASGRETRSKDTWNIQEENFRNNNDFLVMLYDKSTKELAGCSHFVVANAVATYAIAAYDRSRFDTCVGHVAQDAAINYMKTIGIKWYEIGERLYANDIGADSKNINIGLFKEKFATHMFCVMEWTYKGLRGICE